MQQGEELQIPHSSVAICHWKTLTGKFLWSNTEVTANFGEDMHFQSLG